jgi:hypothetical protein
MKLLPRFRGSAFEEKDGWSWEVCMTTLGDNDDPFYFSSNVIFPTKEIAIEDMKVAIKLACDEIQRKVMGKVTGEYIDMKTNETMNWNKH